MVAGFTNFLTNPTLSTIAQSTTSSVSIETGLKAVGRPSFILADNKIEDKTKKYAATKEFLYQATCLATYMAIVTPIFKNGAFKLAKKMFKDEKGFQLFKNANQYLNYKKLASMSKEGRCKLLEEPKNKNKFSDEVILTLKKEDKPDHQDFVKGVIELGNIIGSVFGLAIFAPQVSHLIVHPTMSFLGMDKKPSVEDND